MTNVTAAETSAHARGTVPPVLFVLAAALLWSTGGAVPPARLSSPAAVTFAIVYSALGGVRKYSRREAPRI